MTTSTPTATAVASSRAHDVEHRYALGSDTPIHYVRMSAVSPPAGEQQPAMMLLHGFPQSWRAWRWVAELLCEDYLILVPDLRGFGDSGPPPNGYGTTMVGPDLQAVLDDAGVDRVTLVGHDISATSAYFFAAARPEVVERLVFIEAALPTSDRSTWPSFWHWPSLTRRNLAETIISGNEETFVRALIYDYAERTANLEEDIPHYARHLFVPGGLQSVLAWFREGVENDTATLQAQLPARLRMPVLALGGSVWGDRPLHMLKEVVDDVRGGTMQGVGHWIPEEGPHELATRLRDFVLETSP